MRCETCHGTGKIGPLPIPCEDCGGCGFAHCCEGADYQREHIPSGDCWCKPVVVESYVDTKP